MQPLIRLRCPLLFNGDKFVRQASIEIRADRITAVGVDPDPAAIHLPEGYVVAPGLIDIQVNGGGGLLFNDSPDRATIRHIAAAHARCGTTALLPTFITDAPHRLDAAVAAVRGCLEAGDPGIVGVHLEGPFLQTRRRGIHREDLVASASELDTSRLTALGDAGRTLITLAPECVDRSQIRALAAAGSLVFAGHTEATYAQLRDAAEGGGLIGVTHLFNAMSQLGPREAGTLGYALLHPELWAGLILDGHHVARESFELAWRLRGREHTILVSDAMPPAGSSQTRFMLQGREITVRDGRCVDAAGTLAGAAITLADAVRIGIQRYGLQPEDALYGATLAPARLLGLQAERGCLQARARADLVVFDSDYRVAAVMQAGCWIRADGALGPLLMADATT